MTDQDLKNIADETQKSVEVKSETIDKVDEPQKTVVENAAEAKPVEAKPAPKPAPVKKSIVEEAEEKSRISDEEFEKLSLAEQFEARRGNWSVALAPHLRTSRTTQKMMIDVIIALTPQLLFSVYKFGMHAALIIALSVISAVCFEALIQKAFHKKVLVGDLSAVVTGILLAFNLPANVPYWIPIVGSAFAIIIAKEFFGGIGSNFVNPALAGRAALMMSWPAIMTSYIGPDGITGATTLQIMKAGEGTLPLLKDVIIGNISGVLGETASICILIGFIYLVIRKVLDYKITLIYVASTMAVLFALGVRGEFLLYHLFGGGLLLGACFMATDFVTAPTTPIGKIIFALGCGILTALIRIRGGMAEGVSYSILIMNTAVPLIDRLTVPKVFGEVKAK